MEPKKKIHPKKLFEPGSVLYFGADMLEFLHNHRNLRFEFDPTGIDTDNSASGYADIPFTDKYSKHFTYRRIKNDSAYSAAYGFTFVMEDRAVDAFALFYSGNNGTVEGKSKVVVYSSFFAAARRIPNFGLSGLRAFLERNFEIEPDSLWRVDVCADFSVPLPVLHASLFDKVKQWHATIGKDEKYDGFAQTYYTHEPRNSKNRNYLFRTYDKILDSFRKGKAFLFPHLAGAEEVRRVELELRPDACRRLARNPLDLVDNETLLRNVFMTFLANHSSADVERLPLLSYPRYESDLAAAFLALGQLPKTYVSRANGYLRKVREAASMYGIFELLTGKKTSSYYVEGPDGVRTLKTKAKREIEPLVLVENAVHYAASE